MEELQHILQSVNDIHPWLAPAMGVALLLLVAWVVDVVARRQFVRIVHGIVTRTETQWDDKLIEFGVIRRIAHLITAAVFYYGIWLIPGLSEDLVTVVHNVTLAYGVFTLMLAIGAALSSANAIYELRPEARQRPIKGYVQVAKIGVYIFGAILVISSLIGESPLILLSGVGALTAILLLVFKDTILSLVASVQLSSLDMVRVGDWIEMPQFNADGDVIDVALHTIRIQNWDKTITTIPTHRLISDSFKNWRGMAESGGRRIKRSLMIDVDSVHLLSSEESAHFARFALLKDYIEHKQQELDEYNAGLALPTADDVNLRRLTNIGTFRAYVLRYLQHHPSIHSNMTLLVRQLQPTSEGVPIQIYCFTKTTAWNEYEDIQADIFDHLFSILREFDLRAFQQPTGHDFSDFIVHEQSQHSSQISKGTQ